jgi:hypothetical protein
MSLSISLAVLCAEIVEVGKLGKLKESSASATVL